LQITHTKKKIVIRGLLLNIIVWNTVITGKIILKGKLINLM
jgi:hypothetical protein